MLSIFCMAARTERLKQAKDEADNEVQAYKAQREEEFKRLQSEVSTNVCPCMH